MKNFDDDGDRLRCFVTKSRPMTLGEAKDICGMSREREPVKGEGAITAKRRDAEWARAHDELIDHGDGLVFMCGRGLEVVRCVEPGCLYESDVLCDWPMGRGKTCDLALCVDHAKHIGEERDLYPIHFALWVKATGSGQLNAWPPKPR